VTAVAAGGATITATSEGKTGTATVTVNAPPPAPVATVNVSPASSNVNVGTTVQLSATTRDANGALLTGRVVTWTSSNSSLATVSGSGLVSTLGAGTVTITATSEGKTGTATVTAATGSGGSLDPALLSCPAPDIMSHGFDDGTLGPFENNFNAYGKIIADATATGGRSVQQQWFYTPGQEQASGVDAEFPAHQRIYIRWAYKENATFDNSGIKKVVLFRAPSFGAGSGMLTVYHDSFNYDMLNDAAHPFGLSTNVGPEIRPSSLRGSWHWYELENDITVSGALKMRFWIDGVLKMDYTEPLTNGGLTMGALRLGDTFNSPVTDGFDWTDEVAISTQCIKAPW
jgi:Bacterial Ig-like domain (group 2)